MLDWNFIAGLIATVAFDIIYFGAIIGTITVIILDNRNPVKTMAETIPHQLLTSQLNKVMTPLTTSRHFPKVTMHL